MLCETCQRSVCFQLVVMPDGLECGLKLTLKLKLSNTRVTWASSSSYTSLCTQINLSATTPYTSSPLFIAILVC